MRNLLLGLVLLGSLGAGLCWLVLPSTSRDYTREAIDRLGYMSAFHGLDRAIEEYNLRHFGRIPSSIDELAGATLPELGADEDYHAQTILKIVQRTVIKPIFKDTNGKTYSWLAAALVPSGEPHWREYVYFAVGHTEDGINWGSSYARPDEFVLRSSSLVLQHFLQLRNITIRTRSLLGN